MINNIPLDYVVALKAVGVSDGARLPVLLALWYICKSEADRRGVPDPRIVGYPGSYREHFEKLAELRDNLKGFVSETTIDYARSLLKAKTLEEVYAELVPQEGRRSVGQFFTPIPVARRMVPPLSEGSVFDAGVGTGVFLLVALEQGYKELYGIEFSPLLLDLARYKIGMVLRDDVRLELFWGDFLVQGDLPRADLWISNPPYTRHHQIQHKEVYRQIIRRYGIEISRYSSLYAYFFAKFVGEKSKWRRASFICPRSLYDSVYSYSLKKHLLKLGALHAIEIFHNQRIFEDAETGPAISYLVSERSEVVVFRNCILENDTVKVISEKTKKLSELDHSMPWTNIAVSEVEVGRGIKLHDLFEVMRGVATGANDYFVLSESEVKKYGLPEMVLIPVIAKTRYCLKDVFTREDWERLKAEGREVYLLDLSRDESHPAVQRYIELGVKLGIPKRSLVRTRKKWYQMEKRAPPPIFVTYLSRGRPRFILNEAGVVPLNVFLCLYPKMPMSWETIKAIWQYLNSEEALKRFEYLARNYGEDTLKVEPRILGLLEIPHELARNLGITRYVVP